MIQGTETAVVHLEAAAALGQVNEGMPLLQRVAVTQIKTYERNPRRLVNPEFDRIKQSIRECGLDQPLVITCRPGETQYVVHAGGNTRLKILQELYAETHDARFQWAPCVIHPWTTETAVLLAHLRENDLRGALTFIEKARAVLDVLALFEQQLGKSLTHRELAELLRSHGYVLGHSRISQFAYTVEKLLPVMPQALDAGLGRSSVERLRAFERVAAQVWARRGLGDEASFDGVFQTLCRRYDDPSWSFEVFAEALEMEIATAADERLHTIRMEIDGAQIDHQPDADEAPPKLLRERDVPLKSRGVDSGVASFEASPRHRATAEPADLQSSTDINALRRRACAVAIRLAERHGLADIVMPIEAQGAGFVLRDVPSAALAEALDEATLGQLSMLWWHLAACAEMTVAPVASIVALLPATSVLRRALEQNDATLLFDSVWTPDPGQMGDRLWRQLSAADWQDLMVLMETYRRLHQVVGAAGLTLWS